MKGDQPNLGFKDPKNNQFSGFDIEIAKMIAADLGIDTSGITFKEIPSKNRETALANGEVDYYVGTYTINDERKQQVSFAGPYFVAGQDLLVKKDSDIKGPERPVREDRVLRHRLDADPEHQGQTIRTPRPPSSTSTASACRRCSTARSMRSRRTTPSSSATPPSTPTT